MRTRSPSPAIPQSNNRKFDKNQENQKYGNGRQGQGSSSIEEQINLPCVSEASTISETNMPVVKGCIGNKVVNVLRDTGCSRAAIRRDLVKPEQMTGQKQKCLLADDGVVKADVAKIEVDTPYFTGNVMDWCFDNPHYDLILGNFDGVRNPDDLDESWIMSTGTTTAVQTRGQSKKGNTTYKPLQFPNTISDVSTKDTIENQQTDPTLKKLRNLSVKNADKFYRDGGKTKIYVHNKILYREFTSPMISNGKTFHRHIVP
jgi:hypothetical protein